MNLDIARAFCQSKGPFLRFVYSSIARASVPEALDHENESLTEMFTCSLLLVCKTTHSRTPSNMREGSVLEIITINLGFIFIHLGLITNLTEESRIHNSSPQMLRGGALSLEAGATWTEARIAPFWIIGKPDAENTVEMYSEMIWTCKIFGEV